MNDLRILDKTRFEQIYYTKSDDCKVIIKVATVDHISMQCVNRRVHQNKDETPTVAITTVMVEK